MNAATMAGLGPWRQAWRRLRTHRAAMASLVVLGLLLVAALLVPMLSHFDYVTPDWDAMFAAPGSRPAHWLGTDALGRDLLVRLMWGVRISLLVGVAASVISVLIGVLWGATSGYAGGAVDALMMRTVDVLYCVPFIPLVIMLTVLFGRNFLLVFVAIGAVSWLDVARIVRGQTLSLKHREFIVAAQTLGLSRRAMIGRHFVPNLLGVVVIYATLTIPAVILFEAFLSFLGLGVQAPLASLGSLVAEGASGMQSHPYLLIVPSGVLALIIFCFSFLGDGLRDALDPRDGSSR
jgi:oligopeptide transport system permease protein